ncbi:MAG: beta-N-acetylhexosaminidase [Bdellovibrio sp. CG10_big_fil_rev_8_21_14_0_10_47_8]|nr:MAG: beta-N-acetylhexosaminidase [Bdellovibrio sp. CG10_big_fil_rev_8_21_14_0_10_47_8]
MNTLIGQHIVIGIAGHSLTEGEKKFIVENNIGGVVLFSRNVADPKQVHTLCQEIQDLRHQMTGKAPLYIAIDMEGGRVARLKAPFTIWPPLKKLGDLDSPTVSFQFSQFMGQELKAVGINLDFAPCIDVFTNPKNTVIGDRSLSSDPEMVAKHASALIRGYIKAEVIPCAKHFPGHGDTIIDSHADLPIENADLERLNTIELVPFKRAFKSKLDMTMTGHIRFPKIDPEWPVTLSEIFLKKVLREDLRYRGLVISDDLDMKALSAHYDKNLIPVRSLQAGVDLLLYCNEPASPPKAIENIAEALSGGRLKRSDLESSYQRILSMKKETIPNPDPLEWDQAIQIIGNPEHFKLSQSISNGEVFNHLHDPTTDN